MINRRTFNKRVIGIAALSVVGIMKISKPKSECIFTDVTPGPNSAVWYGTADMDYPKGYIGLNMKNGWSICDWIENADYHSVMVNCLEHIKKGQWLVWYPDGTIRGGKKVCGILTSTG